MKNIINKFFILISYLLSTAGSLSAPNPPPPNGRNQGPPPPPPGLPIDEYNIYILFLALFLGLFIIRKHKINKRIPS